MVGKKPSKRSKSKYPALEKRYNLKTRDDYIEPEYIDGVKDEDGNTVIRAMNDEEKQWLNDFYEETVNADFIRDPDLKRLTALKKEFIEDQSVKELQLLKKEVMLLLKDEPDSKKLKKKYNKLISDIRYLKKFNKNDNYLVELLTIEKEMQEIRDEVLFYPNREDHKQFTDANNARNRDIYANRKARGMLIYLDPNEYDQYYQHEDYSDEVPWDVWEELYNKSDKD